MAVDEIAFRQSSARVHSSTDEDNWLSLLCWYSLIRWFVSVWSLNCAVELVTQEFERGCRSFSDSISLLPLFFFFFFFFFFFEFEVMVVWNMEVSQVAAVLIKDEESTWRRHEKDSSEVADDKRDRSGRDMNLSPLSLLFITSQSHGPDYTFMCRWLLNLPRMSSSKYHMISQAKTPNWIQ